MFHSITDFLLLVAAGIDVVETSVVLVVASASVVAASASVAVDLEAAFALRVVASASEAVDLETAFALRVVASASEAVASASVAAALEAVVSEFVAAASASVVVASASEAAALEAVASEFLAAAGCSGSDIETGGSAIATVGLDTVAAGGFGTEAVELGAAHSVAGSQTQSAAVAAVSSRNHKAAVTFVEMIVGFQA